MAWSWANRKRNNSVEWTGFLERGVKVDGRLEATGTFRIDSEMKGNLFSEDTLIVGEHASIEGQITGNEIIIAGRCDGIIRARGKVELQQKAIVTGEIHTPCLIVEPGAVFDGECYIVSSPETSSAIMIPVRSVTTVSGSRN